MKRKHEAYTLWRKWRDCGWEISFTVTAGEDYFPSPIDVIVDWMEARFSKYPDSYWKRGKTWIIKPEGEMPAELQRQLG